MSQHYINAIYKADQLVGRIWLVLKTEGILEETLLIVTSDHGGTGHGHESASPEVLTIPWIAVGPGVPRGAYISQSVRAQDLAPTVLQALGLQAPATLQGRVIELLFPALSSKEKSPSS
jgi:arylsulfatase A-like enzyme